MDFKDFVLEHENDDVTRLVLSRGKWPEIDIRLAVSTIESRKKIKGKLPAWHACPELIFPCRLSAEQASSEETAALKASIAARLAGQCRTDGKDMPRLADLTGGLGADTYAFRKAGFEVLYNEMDTALEKATEHNFKALGLDRIICRNCELVPEGSPGQGDRSCGPAAGIGEILGNFSPDIIFVDPARRSAEGKKVFLLEECRPDILTLKDELLRKARFLMVKLSPMADIDMVCNRLGRTCREIHVLASKGDCRELLAVMDREWSGEITFTAWESGHPFSFTASQKAAAKASYLQSLDSIKETVCLFEPGKALMKSGAYDLFGSMSGLKKAAKSTHLYLTDAADIPDDMKEELLHHGKLFRVIEVVPLDSHGIKSVAEKYPDADVTARNIPMGSDALKSRLAKAGKWKNLANAPGTHVFGVKCEASDRSDNLLIVTSAKVTLLSDT